MIPERRGEGWIIPSMTVEIEYAQTHERRGTTDWSIGTIGIRITIPGQQTLLIKARGFSTGFMGVKCFSPNAYLKHYEFQEDIREDYSSTPVPEINVYNLKERTPIMAPNQPDPNLWHLSLKNIPVTEEYVRYVNQSPDIPIAGILNPFWTSSLTTTIPFVMVNASFGQ